MIDTFYIKGSDEFYFGEFWEENRIALQKQQAVLLATEEANQLKVGNLFRKSVGDSKPNLNRDYDYFAIPYELDDEVYFNECKLIDCIINLINENLHDEKFFASTDNDKCCVIRTAIFNKEILWAASSGHLNTPFVIFDEKYDCFVLLDYDLPIQIIGYKKGYLAFKEVAQWKNYFRKEWTAVLRKYKKYQNLQSLVDRYYSFIELPK
ncbi:MAG: hypothetical protein WC236_05960 [Gallionellaceae bacterium]